MITHCQRSDSESRQRDSTGYSARHSRSSQDPADRRRACDESTQRQGTQPDATDLGTYLDQTPSVPPFHRGSRIGRDVDGGLPRRHRLRHGVLSRTLPGRRPAPRSRSAPLEAIPTMSSTRSSDWNRVRTAWSIPFTKERRRFGAGPPTVWRQAPWAGQVRVPENSSSSSTWDSSGTPCGRGTSGRTASATSTWMGRFWVRSHPRSSSEAWKSRRLVRGAPFATVHSWAAGWRCLIWWPRAS